MDVENVKKPEVKILVVDDREDNLLSIETILEKDNYVIRKATSGRAALKTLLNEHDFYLILMDVQMPDMNGFETASLIYQREKLKHIPIIFITAQNHDETFMFEGYKMGAVDFIYKPINPELLRYKVSVFVELYQKTHQLLLQEKELKAANTKLEKEIEERKINEEKIRLLNEQLLQNNTELKETNEELDRFAYVASHDLQEPLRKIMIFSDVISAKLQGDEKGDLQHNFQKIIKASSRMQKLINDLLKFSKHTNTDEEFGVVDLNKIVSEVLGDLDVELQKKHAKVKVGDLPSIWGVPGQMYQLFQNLISNSLKFCKTDCQPEIDVSCKILKTKEGESDSEVSEKFYEIIIKDNGIGFNPLYADDIFMVFKRLHSHHEFEGTGIGLSICKKIVEKHAGTIAAESKPNEGSTFTILLPKRKIPVNSINNQNIAEIVK
jgi:signal transduction histidine kinase